MTLALLVLFAIGAREVQAGLHPVGHGGCLPYDAAVAKLRDSYGEQRVGRGIGEHGGVVYELYVAETGTWTVLVTKPNGPACIAAAGKGWITTPLLPGEAL